MKNITIKKKVFSILLMFTLFFNYSAVLAEGENNNDTNNPQIIGIVKNLSEEEKKGFVRVDTEIIDEQGNISYWYEDYLIQNDGKVQVHGLAPGDYAIVAFPDYEDNTRFLSERVKITIDSNGNYNGLDIELTLKEAQVRGEILKPDGTPTEVGGVSIFNEDGDILDTIDARNGFSIFGLDDGIYYLEGVQYFSNENEIFYPSKKKKITIDNGKLVSEEENNFIKLYLGYNQKEDVNEDTNIDMLDIAFIATKFNKTKTHMEWDNNLDLNDDGIIDLFDLVMIAKKIH